MRNLQSCGQGVVFICLFAISSTGRAAEPGAAPPTLWSFLGISGACKACSKFCDATVNKHGRLPCLEKKPPLKKLSDPELLKIDNAAIKVAQDVKTQEDLAPQKIKAIKYLGSVGCGCYEEVNEALVAAMADCTEKVRVEAVKAITKAAGNPCDSCRGQGCCSDNAITKLDELAYGQDENGCYKEGSADVREAARKALKVCQRPLPAPVVPETPIRGEGGEEIPTAAPELEGPMTQFERTPRAKHSTATRALPTGWLDSLPAPVSPKKPVRRSSAAIRKFP